jgi:hypothetical protein
MSASGTLFLQTFVFLPETRVFRACQEIRDLLAYGWRRKLPATDPFKSSSATVAETCPSTKKLAIGSFSDCAQVRSCIAGDTKHPTRRAVRKTLTHAKPCQLKHRTPKNREIAVAAAHAEGKTVTTTETQTVETPKDVPRDANPVEEPIAPVAKVLANPNAAPCQLPS